MKKIKYCIWDVGQTIYEYSLDPLHDYLKTITTDKDEFSQRKGRFSYNEYMKGNVSWDNLCKSLSEYYFSDNLNKDIVKEKFFEGIGSYYPQSQNTINYLNNLGIQNGILSNALPVLARTTDCVDNLNKAYCFTSYEMGLLKPDKEIFKELIGHLNAAPEEIIFIDDKPKNIKAAQSIGINGIVYNKATIELNVKQIITKSGNINHYSHVNSKENF